MKHQTDLSKVSHVSACITLVTLPLEGGLTQVYRVQHTRNDAEDEAHQVHEHPKIPLRRKKSAHSLLHHDEG